METLIALFLMIISVAFVAIAMIRGFQCLAQLPILATQAVLGVGGLVFIVWIGSNPDHNIQTLVTVLKAGLDLSQGFVSAFKWVLSHLKLK